MSDTPDYKNWPYGLCECAYGTCQCARRRGPAMFSVVRGGEKIRVCSRCDLTSDQDHQILIRDDEAAEVLETLVAYDSLGALGSTADEIRRLHLEIRRLHLVVAELNKLVDDLKERLEENTGDAS